MRQKSAQHCKAVTLQLKKSVEDHTENYLQDSYICTGRQWNNFENYSLYYYLQMQSSLFLIVDCSTKKQSLIVSHMSNNVHISFYLEFTENHVLKIL